MLVYDKLLDLYVKLTQGVSIATIGAPYSYYYADKETGTDIITNNILNIDIKSAFPTICKILFGKENEFVQEIFKKEDKRERNIFISTTLKEFERQNGINYLNETNLLSKILVFCYVFTFYNDIEILQFVKDGMHIAAKKNEEFNQYQSEFINIMKEYDIQYHVEDIDLYLRFNKTSIFYQKETNKINIKGIYKGPPKCIIDILQKIFEGHYYNQELLDFIQSDYSQLVFDIVYHSQIKEYIEYLYLFDNGKYLNSHNDFTNSLSEISPRSYLFTLIYPVLNLMRIYHSQK